MLRCMVLQTSNSFINYFGRGWWIIMSRKLHRHGISFMNTDTCHHYSITNILFFLGSGGLWCGGRPVHCRQYNSHTCLKFFNPQTASGTSLQLVSLYQSLVIIFCLYVALLCLPLMTVLQLAVCLARIPLCVHTVKKVWINVNEHSNIGLQYHNCVI